MRSPKRGKKQISESYADGFQTNFDTVGAAAMEKCKSKLFCSFFCNLTWLAKAEKFPWISFVLIAIR